MDKIYRISWCEHVRVSRSTDVFARSEEEALAKINGDTGQWSIITNHEKDDKKDFVECRRIELEECIPKVVQEAFVDTEEKMTNIIDEASYYVN